MCAPLSTTTWFHSVAAADAARTRASSSPLRSPSSIRVVAAAGAQPGELARVRGEHAWPGDAGPPLVRRGQRPQCLGVEDRRGAGRLLGCRQDEAQEIGRGQRRPQTGPDDEGVVVVVEDLRQRGLGIHLLDVVLGQGHRRGLDDLGGEQRLERLGHGEGHEPGAGATRGTTDEQRRAGVVQRARDHEQLAERALVATRVAHRDQARHRIVVQPVDAGRHRHAGSRRVIVGAPPEAHRPPLSHPHPPRPSGAAVSSRRDSSWSSRRRSRRASSLRSRSSRRSSMSSGKTYRAAGRPDAERHRDGELRLVADRHRDPAHAQLLGPLRRASVEDDIRLARRQALDLDVAPADAAHAQAQHLGDGLLGRPATREGLRALAHVALLAGREHPVREALPEALDGCRDALDLDDVDPELRRARRHDARRHDRVGGRARDGPSPTPP